jgi:hypothetical protein
MWSSMGCSTLAERCVVVLADKFRTGIPLHQSLASWYT